MKLKLPDVTLVSIDVSCQQLTLLAIDDCLKQVDFGDVQIHNADSGLTKESLLDFAIYELPALIKTSHILFIQWDSWVLDVGMWRDEYLRYDYIGAPWWYRDDLNVGNSGFCLRSKALMEFIAAHKQEFPVVAPEDHTLCRKYRPLLPQFSWAPESLAQDFAFERIRPRIDSRHFGFHGVFNWPYVLSYSELRDRMEIVRRTPYLQANPMLHELEVIRHNMWGRHG